MRNFKFGYHDEYLKSFIHTDHDLSFVKLITCKPDLMLSKVQATTEIANKVFQILNLLKMQHISTHVMKSVCNMFEMASLLN